MSYTPEDQLLKEPLTHLIDSIKEVRVVILNRFESDEWSAEHIEELEEFLMTLGSLSRAAKLLRKETK